MSTEMWTFLFDGLIKMKHFSLCTSVHILIIFQCQVFIVCNIILFMVCIQNTERNYG